MQLYKKLTSPGGKVSYAPYTPDTNVTIEITDAQVATLAATLGTCVLIGLERHLPYHSLLHRKVKAAEDAILQLCKLGGKQIDARMTDAGVAAWGAAVHKLAEELSK